VHGYYGDFMSLIIFLFRNRVSTRKYTNIYIYIKYIYVLHLVVSDVE
jgi:hypothetical protein